MNTIPEHLNSEGLLRTLTLAGLTPAPAQVCGAIRLVPLVRTRPAPGDLRLARRAYNEDLTAVKRGRTGYMSYVPHGLVVAWDGQGQALTATGTQIRSSRPDGKRLDLGFITIRLMQRMAKREKRGAINTLRLLPLHLAMEGFLTLHFGGPDIAYEVYSRRARQYGLSPRSEWSLPGQALEGFEEALRIFEIHEGQVGVLLFVADALASAFVTPHPDDYRALHPSLLKDFYSELIWQYAVYGTEVATARALVEDKQVSSLADLRNEVGRMRQDWAAYHEQLAQGILAGRVLRTERIYDAGPFTLQRFLTDLDPSWENHIGEAIVRRSTGEIEYLKTYRLSAEQARRAYLLDRLAAAGWDLDAAARGLALTRDQLTLRLERADLGYLLEQSVRVAGQRYARSLQRDA